MDVYLPSDFYQLRDDLPDWREGADAQHAPETAPARDEFADPTWKAL